MVIVEKKSEEIALLQSQKHNASEVKRYSGNVENTQCSDVTNNNNIEMDMKNTPTRGNSKKYTLFILLYISYCVLVFIATGKFIMKSQNVHLKKKHC